MFNALLVIIFFILLTFCGNRTLYSALLNIYFCIVFPIRFPIIEISSMSISQSVEAPLTVSDTLTLNGNLNTQNGTGSGNVACTFRKVLSSKAWLEVSILVLF